MVKIIGMIILIMSGILGGFAVSEKYSRRVNFLRQYIDLILNLKTAIKYCATPVGEIIKNYSCSDPLKCYINSCMIFLKDNSLEDSWKKAFANLPQEVGLSVEESNAAIIFGANLGSCDSEGQLNYINHNLNIMTAYLNEAIENKKSKGKLPIILGVGLSLSVAILFI